VSLDNTDNADIRLQRKRWTVTADIQNTGGVYGCEVPQLYLAFPESAGEPPKVLRDFNRSVSLEVLVDWLKHD